MATADVSCGRGDDAEILVVHVDPEARRNWRAHPVGLRSRMRLPAKLPAHLHGRLSVHAVCLEKDQRLRDELDGAGDDQLVGGLGTAARTRPR
jgi:hypothetical protein